CLAGVRPSDQDGLHPALSESEQLRRRINTQLNKAEALHALREFLFFANRGKIRRKQEEEQVHQATCLNLLTNCVITWNTIYMAAALAQLRQEGYAVRGSKSSRRRCPRSLGRAAVSRDGQDPGTCDRCQVLAWPCRRLHQVGT